MNRIAATIAAFVVLVTAAGFADRIVETPQPLQRETIVGRIAQDGHTPWGGGRKSFEIVTNEVPGVRMAENIALASEADYQEAERNLGMVCELRVIRATRGQWSTWLVVESIEVRR